MKNIRYIILACMLIIASLVAWRLCTVSEKNEEPVQLMPLFTENDTLASELKKLGTISRKMPERDENYFHTEEYNKVHQIGSRLMLQRVILDDIIPYLETERETCEESRREANNQEMEIYLERAQEAALTGEDRKFLNQLIKTYKITMDTDEKN